VLVTYDIEAISGGSTATAFAILSLMGELGDDPLQSATKANDAATGGFPLPSIELDLRGFISPDPELSEIFTDGFELGDVSTWSGMDN